MLLCAVTVWGIKHQRLSELFWAVLCTAVVHNPNHIWLTVRTEELVLVQLWWFLPKGKVRFIFIFCVCFNCVQCVIGLVYAFFVYYLLVVISSLVTASSVDCLESSHQKWPIMCEVWLELCSLTYLLFALWYILHCVSKFCTAGKRTKFANMRFPAVQ